MSNARGIADSDLSRLTVDSTTLVVDDTNNRVGIGTSSPSAKIEAVAGTGVQFIGTFKTGDATAANNTGGGFYGVSSATAGSREAIVWLDADGGNFGGGDYFYINKRGNSGNVELIQQSNAAMKFQTNAIERMSIDSAGRVTMPYQPAFLACGAGATPNTNGAIFPYSVAVHDVGGHYNTATYRFTAPVAGHYRFSYNCLFNASSYGYASLHKNGAYVTGYGSIGIKQGSGVEAQSSATVVAYANAGDYFDVRIWFISSGYFGIYDNHASFSGELIG